MAHMGNNIDSFAAYGASADVEHHLQLDAFVQRIFEWSKPPVKESWCRRARTSRPLSRRTRARMVPASFTRGARRALSACFDRGISVPHYATGCP